MKFLAANLQFTYTVCNRIALCSLLLSWRYRERLRRRGLRGDCWPWHVAATLFHKYWGRAVWFPAHLTHLVFGRTGLSRLVWGITTAWATSSSDGRLLCPPVVAVAAGAAGDGWFMTFICAFDNSTARHMTANNCESNQTGYSCTGSYPVMFM